MELKIRKAAVLGAGVMGAQIAAHLAAAGFAHTFLTYLRMSHLKIRRWRRLSVKTLEMLQH